MKFLSWKLSEAEIWVGIRTERPDMTKKAFEFELIDELLKQIGAAKSQVNYGPLGEPLLSGSSRHLSISHSELAGALILSDIPVGIDIQKKKATLDKPSDYFMNEAEMHFIDSFSIHLIWCAKEAIYKRFQGEISNVQAAVVILEIDVQKETITAQVLNQTIDLKFHELEEAYYLVYTLN